MIKALVVIAVVCILIATLPPIAVYTYFSDRLNDVSESYELQISELQNSTSSQIDEEFREKVREFMKGTRYQFDIDLMEPYLVTRLGWYLHNSTDPVPESRNKLTIYGTVMNYGSETAYNCKLTIYFYNQNKLVKTHQLSIGTIRYWDGASYIKENIDCIQADNVTKIEVERTWETVP